MAGCSTLRVDIFHNTPTTSTPTKITQNPPGLVNISTLDLSHTLISGEALTILSALSALQFLNVASTKIDGFFFVFFFFRCLHF